MNFYFPPKKKKQIDEFFCMSNVKSVWYICLKIKNYYLKIFMKIHVSEKVRKNTNQTLSKYSKKDNYLCPFFSLHFPKYNEPKVSILAF